MSVHPTIPTLCDTAAHKIAIHLLTKCFQLDYLNANSWEKHKYYHEQHKSKILALPIPRRMIELIQRAMKAVNYEIRQNYIRLTDIWNWTEPSKNIHRICWTATNEIDVKQTIKSFLFDETFKITDRYELACNYRIEEAIPVLWNQLSDLDKQRYFSFEYPGSDKDALKGYNYVAHIRQCPRYVIRRIINYLTNHFPGRSVAESLVNISLVTHSNVAFIYYWEKLRQEEKDRTIVRCCKKILRNHHQNTMLKVFNFLVCQLNDSQQRELIQKFPYKMAICFFICTSVRNFSEVNLQYLWKSLFAEEYYLLLQGMNFEYFIDFYDDEDFYEIFVRIWSFIPAEMRKSIKSNPWSVMSNLIKKKFFGCARFLLSQTEEQTLKQLVFSKDFQNYFAHSFACENVEFLYEMLTKLLKLGFKQIQIITRTILFLDEVSLDYDTFCSDSLDESDRFLNYVFLSKKKVTWLKTHLVYKHGRTLCSHCLDSEKLDHHNRFLLWGLGSQEEITTFRKSLLNDNEFFYYPLSRGGFRVVDKFLRQCVESDEEIQQLKMKLLLDSVGLRVFKYLIVKFKESPADEIQNCMLCELLQWFNPSSIYFAEFRDKMKLFLSKWLDSIFEQFLIERNFSFSKTTSP